jgi:hypothetical protein
MLITLTWNARGINNFYTMARLKNLLSTHKLNLVVFLEPLTKADKLTAKKLKVKFDHVVSNLRITIWIFRDNTLHCSIIHDGGQSLTLHCHHEVLNKDFLVTRIYA